MNYQNNVKILKQSRTMRVQSSYKGRICGKEFNNIVVKHYNKDKKKYNNNKSFLPGGDVVKTLAFTITVFINMDVNKKKIRIRETSTLSTDAESSTAAKKLLSIFLYPSPPPARGF